MNIRENLEKNKKMKDKKYYIIEEDEVNIGTFMTNEIKLDGCIFIIIRNLILPHYKLEKFIDIIVIYANEYLKKYDYITIDMCSVKINCDTISSHVLMIELPKKKL